MDTVVREFDDCFNSQANETIRHISAMCVWKERQSHYADNIRRQLATTYKLNSTRCMLQSSSTR